MRSLLRISLVALALAAGCGQKGPLTLKPLHAKTPVAADNSAPAATPAAAAAAAPAAPSSAAPVAEEKQDPTDDKPPAPRG